MTADVADVWDAEADRFDEEPDHGLLQPSVRAAWKQLLQREIPSEASVLDVGCGTGTLSVLLAEHGCRVTGVDLSPRMVERARAKALQHGVSIDFLLGDAADPPVPQGFDIVLARHVLWALPDASTALDRWLALTTAAGRLVLVEGLWGTGAGLPAEVVVELVRPKVSSLAVRHLTDPLLWGRVIEDERYLVVAEK